MTVTHDFLATLLAEDTFYPWNPADPASEAFLSQIEQDSSLLAEEDSNYLESQANQLFEKMQAAFRYYDH